MKGNWELPLASLGKLSVKPLEINVSCQHFMLLEKVYHIYLFIYDRPNKIINDLIVYSNRSKYDIGCC